MLSDDRPKFSPGVKFAKLIGMSKIVIGGRGVEVRDRALGDRVTVPIDGFVAALAG